VSTAWIRWQWLEDRPVSSVNGAWWMQLQQGVGTGLAGEWSRVECDVRWEGSRRSDLSLLSVADPISSRIILHRLVSDLFRIASRYLQVNPESAFKCLLMFMFEGSYLTSPFPSPCSPATAFSASSRLVLVLPHNSHSQTRTTTSYTSLRLLPLSFAEFA
jgi:hypothetical protein